MKDTTFNARRAERDAKRPRTWFPTATLIDVTASFPDGSIEVLARIGQSEVTLRLSRADAIEAGIIENE